MHSNSKYQNSISPEVIQSNDVTNSDDEKLYKIKKMGSVMRRRSRVFRIEKSRQR